MVKHRQKQITDAVAVQVNQAARVRLGQTGMGQSSWDAAFCLICNEHRLLEGLNLQLCGVLGLISDLYLIFCVSVHDIGQEVAIEISYERLSLILHFEDIFELLKLITFFVKEM